MANNFLTVSRMRLKTTYLMQDHHNIIIHFGNYKWLVMYKMTVISSPHLWLTN